MIDLSKLETLGPLKKGKHSGPAAGACVMEAAAYVAGEPWSDKPECVCPVIGAFLRVWNDALPTNDDRDRLLRPLIPKILNTRAGAATQERRSHMAMDWLIRTNLPAWLRLAKLDDHADAVAALQPLLHLDAVASAQPVLDAASDAAWAAAMAAASDAAWAAVTAAAWAAASDAAWAAVTAAAGAAASDAAWAAACASVRAAAWGAAWDAAQGAFSATITELQASAVDLVERMAVLGEGEH